MNQGWRVTDSRTGSMGLYDSFGYSAGFVVVNIFSTIFMASNLAPLQNVPGKAGAAGRHA